MSSARMITTLGGVLVPPAWPPPPVFASPPMAIEPAEPALPPLPALCGSPPEPEPPEPEPPEPELPTVAPEPPAEVARSAPEVQPSASRQARSVAAALALEASTYGRRRVPLERDTESCHQTALGSVRFTNEHHLALAV